MLLATTDTIPGHRIVRTLGLVRGNTVRAKHVGRDIVASFRNFVGGEVSEYTKLLAESRNFAIQRMVEQTEKMEGNAIIGLRFTTSQVMSNAAEIMAYGTAVVIEADS